MSFQRGQEEAEVRKLHVFPRQTAAHEERVHDPPLGEGVARISDALRALSFDCETVGDDLLISARLREW